MGLLKGALVLLGFAIAFMAAARAESATVRSAEHEGFARIVFQWDEPTRFEASIEDRRLTIRFDRPIDADLDAVVTRLGGAYLLAGAIAADGRSVTFELTRPFLLRSFPQALTVVIDLIEPEESLALPGETPAAQQSAADPEPSAIEPAYRPETPAPLGVRVGEHESFDRVVFDWPEAVDYRVEQQGRAVTVIFARPATIDLEALRRDLPPRLSGVELSTGADGLVVAFERRTAGPVHHFVSGTFVAVDFQAGPGPAALEPEMLPAGGIAENAEAEPASGMLEDALAAGEPAASEAESAPTLAMDQRPAPDSVGEQVDAAALGALAPHAAPTSSWGMTPLDAAADGAPVPLLPGPPGPSYVVAPQITATSPAAHDEADQALRVPVRLSHVGAGLRIRFAWDESTGAAVYSRNGALWIVFDAKREIALPNLAAPLIRNAGILGGEELQVAGATVLRLDVEADVYADVRREGTHWLVDVMRAPSDPLRMLAMRIEPDGTGFSRIVLPDSSVGPVLRFTDPVVGDQLAIVPLYGSGHGVAPGRAYAQFAVLPSAQGIVVRPFGEDVLVHGLRTGVEISSAHGLQVSSLTAGGAPLAAGDGGQSRIFRFDDWRAIDALDFTDSRSRYLRAIAKADDATRPEARFNLARFYVANDLYVDALGVLALIEEETPDLAGTSDFATLRGAALFLAGRMDAAAHDLERAELDEVAGIAVWRAAVASGRGDWERGAELFKTADRALLRLPADWQGEFRLLAVRAAIETGDLVRAHFRLDQIEKTNPTPLVQSEIDFLRGRTFALQASFDAALALWDEVAVGPDRLLRAEAALARVRLLRELDWIIVPEAIEVYEGLRFAWRGDTLEQDVLNDLGALYIDQGDYLEGLLAWRQAAANFADSPATREIAEALNDVFARLYVEDEAARLSPLDALSIYFEFRELTPDGAVGDRIIAGLADRLVGIDLLDRAGALLEHQIEQRLTGIEKARVGAQLAAIHLIDHNPEGALAGIELSQTEGVRLPATLLIERRHLEVRALIELGRLDEARQQLAGDSSRAAEMLRADIGWRDQNWSETAAAAERALRSAAPGDRALSETERYYVMMRAVALVLIGDDRSLVNLQRRFGPTMAEGAYADAFALIASAPNPGRIPFREFAKAVADVSAIEAFLDGYRGGV